MPINTLLNKASASKVSEGLLSIKINNLPNDFFIPNSNPFSDSLKSPEKIIKEHPIRNLTSTEVKEFIAVSTIVHCIDGWTYLNNAINAFLNGDPSIAIHLSYYAELRSAMSFLASEGILIANMRQICVESNDSLYIPGNKGALSLGDNSGSHKATWKIMEEWINNNRRQSNALDYFSYKGKTFRELIPHIPHAQKSPAAQLTVLKAWLKVWCLDIEKYTSDREARNKSSYNPNLTRSCTPTSLTEKLININNFWKSLEPSTDSFSRIDIFLLSSYLTKTYDIYVDSLVGTPSLDKASYIDLFLQNSGLSNDVILKSIFVNNQSSTLLTHSNDKTIDLDTGDVNPLSIIARAILLLRYSTGACAFLLKSNNINRQELNFYIDKVGKDWGMWDNSQPTEFKELWDEVSLLLEYCDEYLDGKSPSTIFKVRNELKEYSQYSYLYSQFSRAALWGLCI